MFGYMCAGTIFVGLVWMLIDAPTMSDRMCLGAMFVGWIWMLIVAPIREGRELDRLRREWLEGRCGPSAPAPAATGENWARLARVLEKVSGLPARSFRPEDRIWVLGGFGVEPYEILRSLRREFKIRLSSRDAFGSMFDATDDDEEGPRRTFRDLLGLIEDRLESPARRPR